MARYLSRAELSCIAGKYIEMYYALFGISKNDPAPINPEQFANSVHGLNLKMLPLCSDGHILGLTVFQRCSFTATLEDQRSFIITSTRNAPASFTPARAFLVLFKNIGKGKQLYFSAFLCLK